MITLTSFVEARELEVDERWSGARWAPSTARNWPIAEWAQPMRADGTAIKLRDFGKEPLPKYREYVLGLYRERWVSIREWLRRVDGLEIALACWCPFTKIARRQLEEWGTFHCHLGVVGEVLTAAQVEWEYGVEHEKGMVR